MDSDIQTILTSLSNIKQRIADNYNEEKFEENLQYKEKLEGLELSISGRVKELKRVFKTFVPITCIQCGNDRKKTEYYSNGSKGDKTCAKCKKTDSEKKKEDKLKAKMDAQDEKLELEVRQLIKNKVTSRKKYTFKELCNMVSHIMLIKHVNLFKLVKIMTHLMTKYNIGFFVTRIKNETDKQFLSIDIGHAWPQYNFSEWNITKKQVKRYWEVMPFIMCVRYDYLRSLRDDKSAIRQMEKEKEEIAEIHRENEERERLREWQEEWDRKNREENPEQYSTEDESCED